MRRLVITLAWFSPINPANRKYRKANLSVEPPDDIIGVVRKNAENLDEEVYYGLAVTLEVGESVDLPIYEEIKDRISIHIQDKEEIQ